MFILAKTIVFSIKLKHLVLQWNIDSSIMSTVEPWRKLNVLQLLVFHQKIYIFVFTVWVWPEHDGPVRIRLVLLRVLWHRVLFWPSLWFWSSLWYWSSLWFWSRLWFWPCSARQRSADRKPQVFVSQVSAGSQNSLESGETDLRVDTALWSAVNKHTGVPSGKTASPWGPAPLCPAHLAPAPLSPAPSGSAPCWSHRLFWGFGPECEDYPAGGNNPQTFSVSLMNTNKPAAFWFWFWFWSADGCRFTEHTLSSSELTHGSFKSPLLCSPDGRAGSNQGLATPRINSLLPSNCLKWSGSRIKIASSWLKIHLTVKKTLLGVWKRRTSEFFCCSTFLDGKG